MSNRKSSIGHVIKSLNALDVGELSSIDAKLRTAEARMSELDMTELARTVEEARTCLGTGDVANFRRLVSQTVAKLGHLR